MTTSAPSAEPSHVSTDRGFFGHPRGLRTLFFTEMWERFSYYGMRAILTLFMTTPIVLGGLGFPASKAGPIYAMYTSLVYLMSMPGGWLADNFLGQRRSVLYGGFVIMVGHILLAMPGMAFFYAGLGCVVIGTGLLKPNISAIVGQLYEQNDQRRDAGFSIFYMGINLGAFTSPIVCGWLAQSQTFRDLLEGWGMDPAHSWHWGFGAAAVGMFFGLIQYVLTGRHLGTAGLQPAKPPNAEAAAKLRRTLWIGVVGSLVLVAALVAFDRTAKQITTIQWTAIPGTEYKLSGIVDGGEDVIEFQAGVGVDVGALEKAIGTEHRTRIEAAVAAGTSSGKIEGASLSVGGFGNSRVLKTLLWEAAPIYSYAVQGTAEGSAETLEFAALDSPLGAGAFKSEVGDENMALVLAAIARGERQGSLSGVSLKVGGLNGDNIHQGYTIAILLIVIVFFARLLLGGDWTPAERGRLTTIFVLFLGAAVFWGVFEQAGSTLTLFADRSTNNSLFGFSFPSSWWQSVNAAMIVLLAPVFAWLWIKLGRRNPSDPAKFSVGLLFAGLGFALLVGGAQSSGGWLRVSPLWLLCVYFLHTVGELWLSPVGLSSMTKLAPARVVGLMMGVWFLAASVGNFISGSVAGFYEDLPLANLFGYIAVSSGVMAFIMFLLVGPIKRMLART